MTVHVTVTGLSLGCRLKPQVLVDANVVDEDAVIVIAGLSNGYADYTVTFEEFQQQRYDDAPVPVECGRGGAQRILRCEGRMRRRGRRRGGGGRERDDDAPVPVECGREGRKGCQQ